MTATAEPGTFLSPRPGPDSVNFEKRDAILVAGLALFAVGLTPFMAPAYAIAIVAAMFFGIKLYVVRTRQAVRRDAGEGICAECGSPVRGGRCPDCGPG